MTLPRNYLLNGIADALKEAHEAFNESGKETHEALDRATREICNVLKRHNSNVDRERFMRAAGYGTGNREDTCCTQYLLTPGAHSTRCEFGPRVCATCHEMVYPDSSYKSGYRHNSPALHGAAPINA